MRMFMAAMGTLSPVTGPQERARSGSHASRLRRHLSLLLSRLVRSRARKKKKKKKKRKEPQGLFQDCNVSLYHGSHCAVVVKEESLKMV